MNNYSRGNSTMARGRAGVGMPPSGRKKGRLVLLLIITAVILLGTVLYLLRNAGGTTKMQAYRLSCWATQDVTPFGDGVLYLDDSALHYLASNGAVRWSFMVNPGASFAVSDDHIVIWYGATMVIVDSKGRSTYSSNLNSDIQFCRIGSGYAAAVIGDTTAPDLIIKDLDGNQIDEIIDPYNGLMLLDVGFFGDGGSYVWTLSIDLYGTAINSLLNTFQVGRLNKGEANLGDKLVYRVLYDNTRLRVFSTQQMYTYDYHAVQDTTSTMLVYGWRLIDSWVPSRGDAVLLLAPTNQTSSSSILSDLRVLSGSTDLRYTLPASCIGAAVRGRSVYAFTSDYIYRANITDQHFYPYDMPLGEGTQLTSYLGMTSDGCALLASGDTVHSVKLPE